MRGAAQRRTGKDPDADRRSHATSGPARPGRDHGWLASPSGSCHNCHTMWHKGSTGSMAVSGGQAQNGL